MSLNKSQENVVHAPDGPCLVIAGAGTGKTHTLTERVIKLIEDGTPAQRILLLTFTKKAAREMTDRVIMKLEQRNKSSLINGPGVSGGTFHSTALKLLKQYRPGTGSFQILDEADFKQLIKNALNKDGLFKDLNEEVTLAKLSKIFSLKKNTQASIYSTLQKFLPSCLPYQNYIEDCFQSIEDYRLNLGLMTYDDILCHFLELLEGEHGDAIRRRYDYILVDEYQDTTKVQVDILNELSREHKRIMAVGDDCQSIYSFRGSLCSQMNDFLNTFPNCQTISLEGNYRSTKEILDFSNKLIKESTAVFPKTLSSANNSQGADPKIICSNNDIETAHLALEEVQNSLIQKKPLSEFAILYRSSRQTRHLETELQRLGIPYKKDGGLKFNESAHMKDFFSLLNFFLNPQNEPAALRTLQLLNGVGPKTAIRLSKQLRNKESLKVPKAAEEHVQSLKSTLEEALSTELAYEKATLLLKFYCNVAELKYENFSERVSDLNFIILKLRDYPTIEAFLEDLHLDNDLEEENSSENLTLSTVHSAKGKEWETVIILDSSDSSFPLRETNKEIIEEERRLLYVAVTRAKKELKLFYALNSLNDQQNYQTQKLSRFIPSLNKDSDRKKKNDEFQELIVLDNDDFSFNENSGENDNELVYNYDDSW